jgi:hypothetical protein
MDEGACLGKDAQGLVYVRAVIVRRLKLANQCEFLMHAGNVISLLTLLEEKKAA